MSLRIIHRTLHRGWELHTGRTAEDGSYAGTARELDGPGYIRSDGVYFTTRLSLIEWLRDQINLTMRNPRF